MNEKSLNETKKIFNDNENIITYRCDITSSEEIQKMLKELNKNYKIDTLINNAGIASNKSLLETY